VVAQCPGPLWGSGPAGAIIRAMQSVASPERHASHVLFLLACAVIVIGGMKAAQPVLVPLFSAGFLAVLCVPPMRRLQRHGVTPALSVVVVVTGATIVIFLVTALVGSSFDDFKEAAPRYRDSLNALLQGGLSMLQDRGLDISTQEIMGKLDTGRIVDIATGAAGGLIAVASNLFLVVLVVVFMLLEANGIPRKLRLAHGDPDADLSGFARAAEQVQKYLAIKAAVSALTGVLATVLCVALGVDFPLLWGLVAFLFNFVPAVGSIIAAVPPVLLALVDGGPVVAAAVGAGYLTINVAIGNFLEPRLMGRRLGLSPAVVIVSLVFWGWVWGPVGMLLSVPLTVIVKILLEQSEDLRWVGILLGPAHDDVPAAPPRRERAVSVPPEP
jgi:AI-2 transport protein TqsA